jgi:c-di-AMP phosphodiesterase-like protein
MTKRAARQAISRLKKISITMQWIAFLIAELVLLSTIYLGASKILLLIVLLLPVLLFLGISQTKDQLQSDSDLRETVRTLNAKKKKLRKFGIRARFSRALFPLGEATGKIQSGRRL